MAIQKVLQLMLSYLYTPEVLREINFELFAKFLFVLTAFYVISNITWGGITSVDVWKVTLFAMIGSRINIRAFLSKELLLSLFLIYEKIFFLFKPAKKIAPVSSIQLNLLGYGKNEQLIQENKSVIVTLASCQSRKVAVSWAALA